MSGRAAPTLRKPYGAREWSTGPAPERPLSARDFSQVLEQHRVKLRLLRLALAAEHGRRMVGRDRLGRPACRLEAAPVLRDPELVAEDRASRRRTEADEHVRLDRGELGFEPRPARVELRCARRLVDPALAALLELEVLDRVGDVDLFALQPGFGQRPVEHLARRPDERRSLKIFLIAGLLADEHDPRAGRPKAEDGLRGVAVELAALASRRGRLELVESRAGR